MQSTKKSWIPDVSLFELVDGEMKGILRVKDALKRQGLDSENIIFTSKDANVISLVKELEITSMPVGFTQYQLPFLMPSINSIYFLTYGQPNSRFPEHTHTQEGGLRVIINGSIIFNEMEFTAGEWLYISKGCSYSFTVGNSGCVIFHAYGPQDPRK